jgi:hypothetical protein
MRRLIFFLAIVLCLVAVAKEPTIAPELLQAKTVKVKILPGDHERLGRIASPIPDQNAVDDVTAALQTWGRWTVVKDDKAADLIILVRCGQRGAVGATFASDRSASNGDGQERVGAAANGNEQHSVSGAVEHQTPPRHDIIAVFSPKEAKSAVYVAGGEIINAKPLWVMNENGALTLKSVPGVKRLRDDVERAEAAQAKK